MGRKCIQHDGPVGFSNPLNMLEQNDRYFFKIFYLRTTRAGSNCQRWRKSLGIHFPKTTTDDILAIIMQIHFLCIFHGKQSEEQFAKCDKGGCFFAKE